MFLRLYYRKLDRFWDFGTDQVTKPGFCFRSFYSDIKGKTFMVSFSVSRFLWLIKLDPKIPTVCYVIHVCMCWQLHVICVWQSCSRKRQGDNFVFVRAEGTVSFFMDEWQISFVLVETDDSLCANVLT